MFSADHPSSSLVPYAQRSSNLAPPPQLPPLLSCPYVTTLQTPSLPSTCSSTQPPPQTRSHAVAVRRGRRPRSTEGQSGNCSTLSLSLSAGDDGKWESLKGERRLACLPGGGENEGMIDAITIRRTDTHFFSTLPSPPPLSTLGKLITSKARGPLLSLSPFPRCATATIGGGDGGWESSSPPSSSSRLPLGPLFFTDEARKNGRQEKREGAARAEHSQGWRVGVEREKERAGGTLCHCRTNERRAFFLPCLPWPWRGRCCREKGRAKKCQDFSPLGD